MGVSMTENHVESCKCWDCGGWGKVEYEEPQPDPIMGGELVGKIGHCHLCHGDGELYRAKLTQTTVVRAFLTQAKHALEDIDLIDCGLDLAYGRINDVIGDVENYERKVGTRNG
jgi:hypothetical protein